MLNIPFYKNPGKECMQACIKMVTAYYFSVKEIGFDEINKKMGRKKGKWTIPSQAAIALNDFGLKVKCFSSKDYPGSNLDEVVKFYKDAFDKDYNKLKKHLDIKTFFNFHKLAKKKGLYEVRRHEWDEIVEYFQKGYIVVPVIDYNVLRGKDGPYIGHFVVIVDINQEKITIHDPDVGANLEYKKKDFIQAFKTKEIDDDLLVICSKHKD